MLATIAIAAVLTSDVQNYVRQITKWTALTANHHELARHLLMNSQSGCYQGEN
jgi:hypothetical protein